jgi:hypothetical protein
MNRTSSISSRSRVLVISSCTIVGDYSLPFYLFLDRGNGAIMKDFSSESRKYPAI